MSVSKTESNKNENGGAKMQNKNWGLERIWSGLGWGIFFILMGGLIFASNKGWVTGGEGWLYFAIGTGAILIVEFLAHFFSNQANRWSGLGSLVVGLSMVYIGIAFLNGFGDWWPLVFVPVGVGYIAKGILQHRNHRYAS
jgi:hypothetical protein